MWPEGTNQDDPISTLLDIIDKLKDSAHRGTTSYQVGNDDITKMIQLFCVGNIRDCLKSFRICIFLLAAACCTFSLSCQIWSCGFVIT